MKAAIYLAMFAATACLCRADVVPLKSDFNYSGEKYQATMCRNGYFKEIKSGGTTLFSGLELNGVYVPEGKTATQKLHMWSASNSPTAEMEDLGGKKVKITVNGTLSGKEATNAASYTQTAVFTPDQLTIRYQITINQPMKANQEFFLTHGDMPMNLFLDHGSAITAKNGKRALSVPAVYTEYKDRVLREVKQLAFSLDSSVFSVDMAGENNYLKIVDGRQHGGKDMIFFCGPVRAWRSTPYDYTAGTVFDWTVTLSFKAFDKE